MRIVIAQKVHSPERRARDRVVKQSDSKPSKPPEQSVLIRSDQIEWKRREALNTVRRHAIILLQSNPSAQLRAVEDRVPR